jgi:hypothetical protein
MTTRDVVVLAFVIGAFAVLVTVHVTIAAGLLVRSPRWRAPVALVVAPLAPYYAVRARMPVRAATWIGALVVYVVARVIARS